LYLPRLGIDDVDEEEMVLDRGRLFEVREQLHREREEDEEDADARWSAKFEKEDEAIEFAYRHLDEDEKKLWHKMKLGDDFY